MAVVSDAGWGDVEENVGEVPENKNIVNNKLIYKLQNSQN